MSASDQLQDQTKESDSGTAIYVYGIVPGDVEAEEDAQGIGDPPAKVEVVREGEIAALVSPVSTDRPLGKPEDLKAHAQLLDGTAAVAPVLPLRFGAVMTDAESVATELLRDHHDEFAQALKALEGHAEYIIKGRYDQKKFLSKLLEENEQARALRDDIRGKPEDASRDSRMALGELIANTVESKRQADTQVVVDALDDVAVQVNVREPTHEWDAVHAALLAQVDRQADVETVLERLREQWGGLVDLRLLGPVAAYDFVVTNSPAG
jgi:hypothetical protein